MATSLGLPEGFQLDEPTSGQSPDGLPAGFSLDEPPAGMLATAGKTALELGGRFIGDAKEVLADKFKGTAEAIPLDNAEVRKKAINDLMKPISEGGEGLPFQEAMGRVQAVDRSLPRADPRQTPLYRTGEAISDFGKEALTPTPGSAAAGMPGDIAGGFGSLVGNIAPALLGPIGAATSFATLPFGGSAEAAERARKAGATPEEVLRAAQGGGAVAGATDMIDVALFRSGVIGAAASAVKRAFLRLVEGGAIEGSQEALQQFIQNYTASKIYKPDQNLDEGVIYNGIIGAIVGAGAKVGLGALEDRSAKRVGGTIAPSPEQVAHVGAALSAPATAAPTGQFEPQSGAVPPSLVTPPLFPPTSTQTIGQMDPEVVQFLQGQTAKAHGLPEGFSVDNTPSPDLGAMAQGMETRGNPGANIGRLSLLMGSSLYGNPEDIAPVSIKEMLQNSFDALKPIVKSGQLAKGKIDISADDQKRSITISDNGLGMTPEIMGGAFLRLAESHKETKESSGGFGIAKMLYLFGNKQLTVTSMRNGKVHEMTTSGPELLASTSDPSNENLKPRILSRDPTRADRAQFPEGHGTQVTIIIPKEYRDPSSGAMKEIPFRSYGISYDDALRKSPLFHNIDVTVNGTTLPIGANFDHSRYTQFSNVNFDWGTARVYVTKNSDPISSYEKNVHVLSNGLWQFDIALKKDPTKPYGENVQRDIYIDVSPKVRAEDPGYPFALNRQDFSKSVKDDFGKILNYMSILYRQQDAQEDVLNYGNIQYLQRDKDGIFASPSIEVRPTVPQAESAVTLIKPGDEVSVENGKLIVNGRKVPELTPTDLEKLRGVDVSSLTIPQSQIDPELIILHDNVDVQVSNLEKRSLVRLAREKFGTRFDEFMHDIGDAFRELRDTVVKEMKKAAIATKIPGESQGQAHARLISYDTMSREPVGISFDQEYRGVSIVIPFRAAFINPAVPEYTDSVRAGVGVVGTMVHELAHHKVRNHEAAFPAEMQRLTIALESSKFLAALNNQEGFDFAKFKINVINMFSRNEDIFQYLHGVLTSGTFPISPRGKRLEDSSQRQATDGGAIGDLAAPSVRRESAGLGSPRVPSGAQSPRTESGPPGVPFTISGAQPAQRGTSGSADSGLAANQRALDRDAKGTPATEQQPETVPIRESIGKLFHGTGGSSKGTPSHVATFAAHADRMNRFYKWAAGLDQLITGNPNFTPLLQYGEQVRQMHKEESAIHNAALSISKRWRGLGSRGENLTALLHDMANMTYLSAQEVKQGITRIPSPQEFAGLVAKHKIDAETLKVFDDIRKMFDEFLAVVQQNAITAAQRIISDPTVLMSKVNEIAAQIAEMKKRPYFPFMRFGRHFVMKKDAAGRIVAFQTFERQGLRSAERVQMRAKEQIEASKVVDEVVSHGILSESSTPFIGMPPVLLNLIKTQLQLTPDQLRDLEQIQLAQSPALSFNRLMKSNYVPGYSMDFKRSFAKYFFHGGKYHARTKFGLGLRQTIGVARDTPNDNKAHMIASYMQDHLDNTILDAKGDFGLFKGGIFLWALGYSPYAAAQNLTQMPMVIYPVLAAKFGGVGIGDARAGKALVKAMTNIANFYKRGAYKNSTEFEMQAIDYGIKTGVISETQAPQLAGLSTQNNLYQGVAGNTLERGLVHFQEKAAWLFEMSEQFLRRSTYAAALELAQKYPTSVAVRDAVRERSDEFRTLQQPSGNRRAFSQAEAAALVTAASMTEKANFVYARYARPRMFRGKVAGTLFVFKKYMQSLIMLLGQNKADVLPRYLLMAALLGGQSAVPGYDEFRDLLKFFAKILFGKNFNLDLKTREWVTQLTNGTIPPDIILHGLARAGFGLPALIDLMGSKPSRGPGIGPGQNWPVPTFDMSRMVSTGPILPVELGKLLDPGKDVDKTIGDQAQRASGAVFSVGFNIYKALQGDSGSTKGPGDSAWWQEWKRWEKTMPRALKDASQGYRAYSEGRVRGKGGPESAPTIVPFDPRDTEQMAEAIGMGLGFTPRRLQDKWDSIIAKVETDKYFDTKKQVLMQQMFEATAGKIPQEIDAVRKDIIKYNQELPDYARGEVITADTVQSSMQTRFRERNARESGIPVQKSHIGISQHIDKLFPGTVVDVRRAR